MAEPPTTGMEIAEMKRLLGLSREAPLGCAIGGGDDRTIALLRINRVKAPKAVLKDLEEQFSELANPRFGTVQAMPDGNARTVRFVLNKPSSGLSRKLVKTLKGAGYSKVELEF
ncbi:hypothetical protein [Siccirubricoccus deserti]|uniref:Uncharacterized protein n=1 Tax=Siccirubricoccus deserti TaxID=2013562 RepID=A0A9X0R3D1_9PROT|nr:hypothetical protein [Siccirubricoccus deserti]MBC4018098.1 hypothetical protein [Siccirubricoccus deserti]